LLIEARDRFARVGKCRNGDEFVAADALSTPAAWRCASLFDVQRGLNQEIAMAGKKILIVDDSATDRYFFMETLSKQGYECVTARNGDEAIQKSKSDRPDLILMDIVMPGMDGYKATRTISQDEATKHIPVIICSSKNHETDRVWGLRQGAKDFLVKPVSAKELISKVAATAAG
jgi:twitching motility two-component system response regulator PilH